MRVEDLDSYNGIFFRGRKEVAFEIAPGDTFNIATARLIALNEPMRIARPVLAEVLGQDRQTEIDDVLIGSVFDDSILVVGSRGGGHLELVRAIHDMSIRRNESFVAISEGPATHRKRRLIGDACRGTLVLSATAKGLDETIVNAVMHDQHGARLVVHAPSLWGVMRAAKQLRLTFMRRIEIRPMRDRLVDIPRVFDLNFARVGSSIRFIDLKSENQGMLLSHHWPGNLAEIRRTAVMIASLTQLGSLRKAARSLTLPRSTVQYRCKRLRLSFPLVATTDSLSTAEETGI